MFCLFRQIVKNNNYNKDEYVQGFGMGVEESMMDVQGRSLLPPKVMCWLMNGVRLGIAY
jgi:hypothetical protein